jgi:hypothetical protein
MSGRIGEVRVISVPARPNRPTCQLCGRQKLSREEYNWRRRNGYAVWRCQHRRQVPSHNRDLIEASGVIAALVVCAYLLAARV